VRHTCAPQSCVRQFACTNLFAPTRLRQAVCTHGARNAHLNVHGRIRTSHAWQIFHCSDFRAQVHIYAHVCNASAWIACAHMPLNHANILCAYAFDCPICLYNFIFLAAYANVCRCAPVCLSARLCAHSNAHATAWIHACAGVQAEASVCVFAPDGCFSACLWRQRFYACTFACDLWLWRYVRSWSVHLFAPMRLCADLSTFLCAEAHVDKLLSEMCMRILCNYCGAYAQLRAFARARTWAFKANKKCNKRGVDKTFNKRSVNKQFNKRGVDKKFNTRGVAKQLNKKGVDQNFEKKRCEQKVHQKRCEQKVEQRSCGQNVQQEMCGQNVQHEKCGQNVQQEVWTKSSTRDVDKEFHNRGVDKTFNKRGVDKTFNKKGVGEKFNTRYGKTSTKEA